MNSIYDEIVYSNIILLKHSSLVLVGEAAKNSPSDQVASDIDGGKSGHACSSCTVCGDLAEWVAGRRSW